MNQDRCLPYTDLIKGHGSPFQHFGNQFTTVMKFEIENSLLTTFCG